MNKLLSLELERIGFKSVLNRTERVGNQKRPVGAGVPYTFDSSNGMMAIYDERGKPWVGRSFQLQGEVAQRIFGARSSDHWKFEGTPLRKGAYVPFSHDGSAWACENLPRVEA